MIPDAVRPVVASRGAWRDPAPTDRATLSVVPGDAVHYLGLAMRRAVEGDGGAMVAEVARAS